MDKSVRDSVAQLDAAYANGKLGAREELLNAAYKLVASLESPSEFIARTGWAEPARNACVRSAIDMQLFEKLQAADSLSVTELSKQTGAEEALLARLLKHLAALNVIQQVAVTEYSSTALSNSLTEPKYRDGFIYCYDVAGPSFRELPNYLSAKAYANPVNPVDGPFQFAHRTRDHFFAWLGANQRYFAAFGSYMGGYRSGKVPWHDPVFFPVAEKLQGCADDQVVLVDVGGGEGHDIASFQSMHPGLKGKLILQDKPEVIAKAQEKGAISPGIEAAGHDFFTEQPVKGAKAYFLHSVMHDWDDESCVKILKNLSPALGPDSRVLINEYIVPDVSAAWSITSMDWLMMVLGSAKERTESDFRRLLTAAGYRIDRIWSVEQGTESIIEASLA